MARIRTIKPEFWKHEDLSALPEFTHMLAAALLNHADDEGYFNANPALVKSECLPLRESSLSVRDCLIQLAGIGFIQLGDGADGKRYGRVVKFEDHQRVNRPTPSKIKAIEIVWEGSPKPHTQLSESSPPEGKGKEQGREGNGEGTSSLRSESSAAAQTDLTGMPGKVVDLEARTASRLAIVTEQAIEAYNRILAKPNGLLTAVHRTVGHANRQKEVKRCLKVAADICKDQFRDPKVIPDFWEMLFNACAEDNFHSGRGPYGGQHTNWRPDFEYLTREKTVLKVFERAASDAEAG